MREKRTETMGRWRRCWGSESGAGVVEWIIVTLILTVAFLAILQVVGGRLAVFFNAAWQWLAGMVGG
jgi:Flp pilus assembly pilin Flp